MVQSKCSQRYALSAGPREPSPSTLLLLEFPLPTSAVLTLLKCSSTSVDLRQRLPRNAFTDGVFSPKACTDRSPLRARVYITVINGYCRSLGRVYIFRILEVLLGFAPLSLITVRAVELNCD